MSEKNPECIIESPDAELARYLQRFWPHRSHEAGTLPISAASSAFTFGLNPTTRALPRAAA